MHSEAVIDIVRREFPFATIVGVESEDELESSLVDAVEEAPLNLSTTVNGVQVNVETGCLLRGAGERDNRSAFIRQLMLCSYFIAYCVTISSCNENTMQKAGTLSIIIL